MRTEPITSDIFTPEHERLFAPLRTALDDTADALTDLAGHLPEFEARHLVKQTCLYLQTLTGLITSQVDASDRVAIDAALAALQDRLKALSP